MDMSADTDAEYPSELRENYKMSRCIGRYGSVLFGYFVADSVTASVLCRRDFTHLLAQGALTVSSSDLSG